MKKGKRRMTGKDRFYIEIELRKGTPVKEIAESLGFSRQALYYEISKGKVKQLEGGTLAEREVYLSDYAQMQHKKAMSRTGRKRKYHPGDASLFAVSEMVRNKKYSPEAAILTVRPPFCIKTYYNYVHAGLAGVQLNDLPYARAERRKKGKTPKRPYRRGGRSIEERPKNIGNRMEFGHWEMDTVYSSKDDKSALLVLSERKTRHEIQKTVQAKAWCVP